MNLVKQCAAVAVTFAMFATPALSQGKRSGRGRDITDSQTLVKRAKDAQVEKDYKAALDKSPDQKANADPWGNVRTLDQAGSRKSSSAPASPPTAH